MWIRIRIHLGPWIRIQSYKIKGKASLTNNFFGFVWVGNYIFSICNKKVAYLKGLGRDLI